MTSKTFRGLLAGAIVLFSATACSFGPPPPDETGEPPILPSPSTNEDAPDASVVANVIAQDLDVPWGIGFLPDGTALVTERDSGKILSITMPKSDGDEPTVDEVQVVDGIAASGDGGLLGIAVSPEYDEDETVFIYYSTDSDNRIASLKLGEKPEPIVTDIPSGTSHNGGQLAFGPDGFLYATTGDAGDPDNAGNKKNLGGKLLRMTPDGEPAEGNPFEDSLVYAYGFQNPLGLTWNANEVAFITDSGGKIADEVNKIVAGGDYGWPSVEGDTDDKDIENPLVSWKPEEAGCAGAAFADTIFLTACLTGERIWSLEFTEKGTIVGSPAESLNGELGRLRAIVTAPDGTLWISTSNTDGQGTERDGDDQIIRIVAGGSTEGKS